MRTVNAIHHRTFMRNAVSCVLALSLSAYAPSFAFALGESELSGGGSGSEESGALSSADASSPVTHDQLASAKTALDEATAAYDSALEQKTAADAALEQAQSGYDTANAALNAAKEAKASADADAATAQAAVDAAQAKVDELSAGHEDPVAAKEALDKAKEDNAAAQATKAVAEKQLADAQADAAAKATAYEDASKAAEDAAAAYDDAASAYDDAVAAYNTAKTNYDTGYTDLTELGNTLEKAEQDRDAATQACAAADKAYNSAVSTYETAETAYDEAVKAYNQSVNQNNIDKSNVNKYNSEVQANATLETNAKNAYDSAKSAYDEAKSAKDAAQAVYDAAKAKYDAASNAYNTAKANWTAVKDITYEKQSHNSDEFFKDMNSNTAYGYVTGTNIDGTQFSGGRATDVLGQTDLDSDTDATSIDNMVYAIAMIERYNELRTAAGLSAVGVTDYNMALEQGNVNWSDTRVAHSAGSGNENLAWGYTDPSYGWYYQEKEIFDAEYMRITGSTTGCPGTEVYSWYINNYSQCSFASTVGHYVNFMNPSWTSMGMAYDTNGGYGNCWGESFSSGTSSLRGTIYTASEYRTRFSNWLINKYVEDGMTEADATATVNGMFAKADAYVAFGTASTNYTLAYNEMEDAQDTLTPLAATFASAETAYNDAQTAYDEVSEALATSKVNLEAAKAAEAASAADLATKTTAKNNAWTAYTNAQAAEEQAETAYSDAKSNYRVAAAALASAQSAFDTAKANNATLTSALNTATANKDAAETAKNDALAKKQQTASAAEQAAADKTAADSAAAQAQTKLADATSAAAKTQADQDAAQAAYDAAATDVPGLSDALAQLEAAKQTLAAKQEAAEAASTGLAAKQAAYDSAKTNLDAAKASSDTANANYSSASAAKDSAQSTYDALYQRHLTEGHAGEAVDYVPATCTTAGSMASYICSVCGETLEAGKTIPALGHDWGAWERTKAPTDKADGAEERACSRCGATEERSVAAYTGVEAFAYRLYAIVLDREPDPDGFQVQVNALKRGASPAEIAYNYFNSAEYFGKHETADQTVERVYRVMFGRDSDSEGKAYWVGYLESGMSVRAVVQGFSQSDEYRAYFGSLGLDHAPIALFDSNADKAWDSDGSLVYAGGNYRDLNRGATEFAKRMYTVVLGREDMVGVDGGIDVAGLNVQSGAIVDGMPCWQIAYNYFDSDEFLGGGHSNYDAVAIAYEAILGRTGSDSEIRGWVEEKEDKCYSAADLVLHFCNSNEFNDICAIYGLTSGMRGATAASLPTARAHTWSGSVCAHCGKVAQVAHVHAWGGYTYNNDATCEADGTETRTCACGETETRTAAGTALGHDYSQSYVSTYSTCTSAGVRTYVCSHDSSHTKTSSIAALGHEWYLSSDTASCTSDGVKTYTCTRDSSHTYTESSPALGHNYEDGVCTRCGARVAHVHAWGDYTYNNDATCEADGTETRACACGETETRTAAGTALGHDYSQSYVSTYPTCTSAGARTYVCSHDSSHTYAEAIPALGHNYVNGFCTRCGVRAPIIASEGGPFASIDGLTFSNGADCPWADDGDRIVSSNEGIDCSLSTFTLTANRAGALSFDYEVSSGDAWGRLLVSVNGTVREGWDRIASGTYSIDLAQGDVVEISYEKESCSCRNCAWVGPVSFDPVTASPFANAKVGDVVSFGSYEQDGDTTNGGEAIEWQVLAVDGDRALVTTRYAIECLPFNESGGECVWADSSLRSWLNGDFLSSAFSVAERSLIPVSELENGNNPWHGTSSGDTTYDRVFLLSYSEFASYLGDGETGKCACTAYVLGKGAYDVDGSATWYLRTAGKTQSNAMMVAANGYAFTTGVGVASTDRAVRPAMWVSM